MGLFKTKRSRKSTLLPKLKLTKGITHAVKLITKVPANRKGR